jgi:dolichyl-phosphate beta-glucosyltransferase
MNGRCAIVVPCYNEAYRLNSRAFLDYIGRSPQVQFVFVNDGSRDHTLDILRCMQQQTPAVHVRNNGKNLGKAETVREGMRYASMLAGVDIVGFWDADLATPLTAIDDMLSVMAENSNIDLIIGSRVKLLGRSIRRKAVRHYLGRMFATFASLTLNLPVYDTQCGAKLFRATPVLMMVIEKPFLSKWVFDVELIARFILIKTHSAVMDSIYEYPLHSWCDVPGSKVKFIDFARAAWDLWRIKRSYFLMPERHEHGCH